MVAAILLVPTLVSGQGFGGLVGIKKVKEVGLKRVLPASVNLNEKRIKIIASGTSAQIPQDLLAVLQTKLVTSIQKDNRYIVDDRNPETLLQFNVTNYYVEARTTAAVANSPACTSYTGKIEVSYQAIEVGTEAPLDSENLQYAIIQDDPKRRTGGLGNILRGSVAGCGGTNTRATPNEARDALVDAIISQMSQRAAPFEEVLTVPLPEGKLEPLSALATSQRWAKLLEDAEKMDPLPRPDDDAYRLYMIGLANEALAYQDTRDAAELEKARRGDVTSDKAKESMTQEEKNFNEAQTYLDKAAKAYKDALQAKPSEKEFREPDARMERAVQLYATINRHKEEYVAAVLKKQQERAAGTAESGSRKPDDKGAAAPTSGSAFNQVVAMCQDRVTDIGDLIRDHPSELRFTANLSLAEELKLKKECGADSKVILEQIKAQVTGKPAPAPSPAKK